MELLKRLKGRNFLLLPVILYLLLYLSTQGGDPIFGSEEAEPMLSSFPNVLLEERFDQVEQSIDIAKEPALFYRGSYINPKEARDLIEVTKFQPVLSMNLGSEKIPLFFTSRNSGIPYYLFKKFTQVFGFKLTKILFDLTIGISTLVFFYLFLRIKFPQIAQISTLLMASSPLFSVGMTDFIGEQFVPLFFWMTLFLINGDRAQKRWAVLSFLVGLHLKLNFLFTLPLMFLLSPKKFYENKKLVYWTLGLTLLYGGILFSFPFAQDEIISASHYLKPFSHVSFYSLELIQFFIAPIKFLTLYVDTTGEHYYHLKDQFDFTPLRNLELLEYLFALIMIPTLIYILIKGGEIRKYVSAVILWTLAVFILGHLDKSYTYRIIISSSLLFVIYGFLIDYLLTLRKELAILTLSIHMLFSFLWIYKFNKLETNPEISSKLHTEVAEYLSDNNILSPVITGSETPWGFLEILSKERVRPIYVNSYHRNILLNKAFSLSDNYFLVYMRVKNTEPNVIMDPDQNGYEDGEVESLLLSSGYKFETIKKFYHGGVLIYWLVKIENPTLKPLSTETRKRLLSIKAKPNYR